MERWSRSYDVGCGFLRWLIAQSKTLKQARRPQHDEIWELLSVAIVKITRHP